MIRKFKHKTADGVTADIENQIMKVYSNGVFVGFYDDHSRESQFFIETTQPEFEENEWLYYKFHECECLFRYNGVRNDLIDTNEYYQITNDINFFDSGATNMYVRLSDARKATEEEISSILIRFAIHKGFKKGVTIAWNERDLIYRLYSNHIEVNRYDNLVCGSYIIYSNKDGWAEIVDDDTIESFEKAVEPLMKYLSENHHPHVTCIVRNNSAEIVEGIKTHLTDKFILD